MSDRRHTMTESEYRAQRNNRYQGFTPRVLYTYDGLAARMLAETGEARTDRWHVLTYKTTCRFVRSDYSKIFNITVELHATVIAELFVDGSVRVFTGGFRTQTTQRRLNAVLGPLDYLVVIRRGNWYVLNTRDSTTRDFAEGMVVYPQQPAVLTVRESTTGEDQ